MVTLALALCGALLLAVSAGAVYLPAGGIVGALELIGAAVLNDLLDDGVA